MEIFSRINFCIGPMSKNIVDSIIDFANWSKLKIILIPSRRQIDYNGGYVNNWKTKEFSEYVKSKSDYIFLERDHGGPDQGNEYDEGIESLECDCNFFDIIHIDPWKKYKEYNDGLSKTIEIINYCYNLNSNLYFEVLTEEAIRPFSVNETDIFLQDLKKNLNERVFKRIIFFVIQSGTKLNEGQNIGNYDNIKLKEMIKLGKKYNILSKEHNGDWVSEDKIKDKFNNELDSINIAPEFGMIETKVILQEIYKSENKDKLFEKFFYICYRSRKWEKWVSDKFDPLNNKEKLIEICGHYLFMNDKFLEIKNELKDIDNKIKSKITSKLGELLALK